MREILAGFTSFSTSRELALGLAPLPDEEDIRLRLRQSAEARRLLSLSPDFHIDSRTGQSPGSQISAGNSANTGRRPPVEKSPDGPATGTTVIERSGRRYCGTGPD